MSCFFIVILGYMLSQLSAIRALNGLNYGSWRDTIEIPLALIEIDLALTTDTPKEPEKHVIRDGETTEAVYWLFEDVHTSTINKRLVMEKYSFGSGVREHILKMSNMSSKLKPMDMGLKDEFIVHLVMSSLPKEFEAFKINYNSQPKS
jgi:hypothetical protein